MLPEGPSPQPQGGCHEWKESGFMDWLTGLHAQAAFINPANPGPLELFIVLAVVLIVFGPKRLPQLARSIGRSITDFKRGLNDVKSEIENAADQADEEDRKAKEESTAAQKQAAAPAEAREKEA